MVPHPPPHPVKIYHKHDKKNVGMIFHADRFPLEAVVNTNPTHPHPPPQEKFPSSTYSVNCAKYNRG